MKVQRRTSTHLLTEGLLLNHLRSQETLGSKRWSHRGPTNTRGHLLTYCLRTAASREEPPGGLLGHLEALNRVRFSGNYLKRTYLQTNLNWFHQANSGRWTHVLGVSLVDGGQRGPGGHGARVSVRDAGSSSRPSAPEHLPQLSGDRPRTATSSGPGCFFYLVQQKGGITGSGSK